MRKRGMEAPGEGEPDGKGPVRSVDTPASGRNAIEYIPGRIQQLLVDVAVKLQAAVKETPGAPVAQHGEFAFLLHPLRPEQRFQCRVLDFLDGNFI